MENLLDNNNRAMNTQVETFIIEETAELIYDNEKLDRWNELVNELGLEGQTTIVRKDKSPIPFMHMKQGLINTFRTLCPRAVNVEAYNATPIPIEILDLVALSKREGYFDMIQIWYDERSPDPVCVGLMVEPYVSDHEENPRELKHRDRKSLSEDEKASVKHWTWSPEWRTQAAYLLGRWADVKQSFEELTERAIKRHKAERENYLRREIIRHQRELDDLQTEAFERFN